MFYLDELLKIDPVNSEAYKIKGLIYLYNSLFIRKVK